MENIQGILRLRWVCLPVEVGFKLLSERGNIGGVHESHQGEHQKQKYNQTV